MDFSNLLMGTRKIAGLEITNKKIRVLVLLKTKTETKKISFNEIDLKEGIIKDGLINREEQFISTLKKLLKEAKPKPVNTPYFVVAISDWYVFSTVLSFPSNLSYSQIEEAIELDSPSFLPWPTSSVYLDWQNIQSPNQDVQEVLVSALPKKIVDSYIEAFKKAGFFIVNLEPASLSLARVIGDPVLSLVVNIDDSHTLITVVDKNSFRFSRVLPIVKKQLKNKNEIQNLIKEISKIINFWESKTSSKPQKIYLLGKDKLLSKEIEQAVKIQVKEMKEYENSILLSAAQRALIPKAFDRYISLLPLGAKESFELEKTKAFLRTILNVLSISFLVVLLLFLGFWFLFFQLNNDLVQKSVTLTPISSNEIKEIEQIAKQFNKQVDKIVQLQKNIPYFSPLIDLIISQKPDGVNLTKIAYAKEGDPINLTGIANSREKILEYKNNLETTGKFTNVELPIKSFEQKENITFTLSLTLKSGILNQRKGAK